MQEVSTERGRNEGEEMSGFPLSIALFFACWSGLFIGLWAQSGFAGIGVASALSALVVIGDEVCKVIRYHA